jgi:RNA polymerase sigma factor (sigma-70 family)
MAEHTDHWQRLIQGLRDGDEQVLHEFWKQYGDSLYEVADKHLAAGMRRRLGPEDVVQSACRTFLRRARVGQFQLPDSESLWRLLCAITLNKIREQTRFHMRQKRGLDQEQRGAVPARDDSAAGFEPAAPGPTPAQAAEFADQLHLLLASLEEEERQILELKLQDCTNEEVAEKLGSSERTVRRVMKRLQARLSRDLETAT